jgi:hypothetical protein
MSFAKYLTTPIAAALVVVSCVCGVSAAKADYTQRLDLSAGIAEIKNPAGSDFTLGIEYEYRMSPLLGIGAFGSYIFSTPGITFIGWPQLSVHPFSTEFLVSVSPVVETGGDVGSHVGVRFGTRLPIPVGAIEIIPTFAIDLISGGPNYIYGLGIQI